MNPIKLIVQGYTYELKEILKARGLRWSPPKKEGQKGYWIGEYSTFGEADNLKEEIMTLASRRNLGISCKVIE